MYKKKNKGKEYWMKQWKIGCEKMKREKLKIEQKEWKWKRRKDKFERKKERIPTYIHTYIESALKPE